MGLKEGLIPPTLNLDNQDPEIQVNVAKNVPFKLDSNASFALNNSFGFGGHNVCIAFSKN
jgi:3-oxoacyl-(acyl-carrier-protein) synthase